MKFRQLITHRHAVPNLNIRSFFNCYKVETILYNPITALIALICFSLFTFIKNELLQNKTENKTKPNKKTNNNNIKQTNKTN